MTRVLILLDESKRPYIIEYFERFVKYVSTNYNINIEIIGLTKITRERLNTYTHVIFMRGIVHKVYKMITRKIKIYVINFDQVTLPRKFEQIRDSFQYNPIFIEYSMANIKILKSKYPQFEYIYFPFVIDDNLFINENPDKCINVCALSNNQYRNNKCMAENLSFTNFAGKWGKERDAIVDKSKILVNIHAGVNYRILETIRCHPAIESKCLILSEPCDLSDLEIFNDMIIYSTSDKFPEKIKDIIDNYQTYYQKFYNLEKRQEILNRQRQIYDENIRLFLS